MRTFSNSTWTAFLLAILLLISKPALSQPSSNYKYSPPAKLNDGIHTDLEVGVVTAGNYDRHDLKKSSFDIYPDIVFPALLDR